MGTTSKAFQQEAQNTQPAADHCGERTSGYVASEQPLAPGGRKVEPKLMNTLELYRWAGQPPAIDSPTSDYGSGTFASLEQAGSSSKEPASEQQTNVESVVLTVGENVEVTTVDETEKELTRPEAGVKRVKQQLPRDKIPRVGDFIVMQGAFPLHVPMPIIVPAIMTTASPTVRFITPEDQKRGGVPTPVVENRPRPRGRMFEDIAELSKSDRCDRSGVRSSSGSGEEESDALKLHPLHEGLNPAATDNTGDAKTVLGPGDRDSTCTLTAPTSSPHQKDSELEPSEGYHSMEWSKGEKPGPHSALLQVSEAHLAILPDEDGDTPLHLAIIKENFPLTQYLVRLITGVNMNLDIANNMRQTPLHLAVITKQPLMVQLLVTAGASVNFPDRRGCTSIHLAAQRRDLRILQILSRATNPLPDFNARNFAGLTAVHVATREASIDILKFLFQMGSNKNAQDASSGRTPLHYAVELENFLLTNFFLENGCLVNAATYAGNTPLHIAAGRKLKEIVALLMAYGANPAIPNGEGDFPSDLPASLLMQRAKMTNSS